MSLFTLQEAHPTYKPSNSLGVNQSQQTRQPSFENVDKPLPSLQSAAIRNAPPKATSLNALDPYHYMEAPSWYTSPLGPPYHSRALEPFQNQDTGCGQAKMHLMTCSSCRRQSLMFMASDFAFYFLLGIGLIYASKRL